MKLIEKLWNWGHLEGSHNKVTGLHCRMTPEEFAMEYGIKKAFMVSYGGNITPPFGRFAERFSSLSEVIFSVLGDGSTPLPESELGNTEDIIAALSDADNISGGIVDDFFSPERMQKFPPEVLKIIKDTLNKRGLKFWCVLYSFQLDLDLEKYTECFDGITFWIWDSKDIEKLDGHLEKLYSLVKDKPVMLGIYLWDYLHSAPMDASLFEMQLSKYFSLLSDGIVEGVIFCSSTVGDAMLETNDILKRYIRKMGDIEIAERSDAVP